MMSFEFKKLKGMNLIEELKGRYVDETSEDNLELKEDFRQVLEIYLKKHYSEGITEQSMMCSIHDYFPEDKHNCVACNLNDNSELIIKYLFQYKGFYDINLTFTSFILLLYLLVERYNEYFKIIELQETYRLRHFQVFQEIKWWANYLKHPKSFLLVHHPVYHYKSSQELIKTELKIDTEFVKKYYSGGKFNDELFEILQNKECIPVIYPEPKELINRFVTAQKQFVNMIGEDENIREILGSKATIQQFFETDETE